MGITRRELLKHFGRGAACLAVSDFIGLKMALGQSAGGSLSPEEVEYRSWEDLYRKKWTWDKIVHCTHEAQCIARCEWSVFVKDGVAFREEQIEHPRSTNPEFPDPGPQGCQRGACCTNQMYAPDRIKYPLKRVGQRGEGKWMRISWDEALTEAADTIIDAMVKDKGARSIVGDLGGMRTWGKLSAMLGVVTPSASVINGDQKLGYFATFGVWNPPNATPIFSSDLIFIWHWNPVYTYIPYFKDFTQARYRGAQIVTVAPDLSPSAVHSDYWIPVEPGTDIALALGMCQVLVEEKLYKPGFLKEQTDLPFLVREDTQKFLRQDDLEPDGREDQFYVYDLKTKQVVPARRDTLELGSVDPALEGRYEVELSDGRKVQIRPVFERLKEMLNDYRPEVAAQLISRPFAKVHPDVIREVARKAGKAKSVRLTSRFNSSKCYHVDLIERSMGLFLVLTGHALEGGYPGNFDSRWGGVGQALGQMERPGVEAGVEAYNKGKARWEEIMRKDPTMTAAMVRTEMGKANGRRGERRGLVPGWQWMYYRAGFKDRWNKKEWHDPHYRDFSSYVEEANKKGWYDGFIGPDKEKVPVRDRVMLAGNYLRRLTGSKVVYEEYTPSLEKIINADFRMSTTGLYADLVLPAACYYEQISIANSVISHAKDWLIDKAVDPLGEAKPDWDIGCLLAKKISERAKERGIPKIYDSRRETTVELDKLYDQYTRNGYKEGDQEEMVDMLYRVGGRVGLYRQGLNLEEVRKAKGIPPPSATPPPGPLHPSEDMYDPTFGARPAIDVYNGKFPHPTLTRRMQFYLDHDWYIEAGEALPVHRPHPLLGGDYPFHQTGGHGRESIHTYWISNPLILRLTRGVPSLLMNKEAAERLGIEDHEEVEVYNDAGLYRVRVKHSTLMRPNQVAIYHCWEKFQLSKGHWNTVNPCVAKPLMLIADYGHLYPWGGVLPPWQVEVARRGARVNIRRIST